MNRICQNLSNSNSSRDFWHLANNISNNLTSSFLPLVYLIRLLHSCLFFLLKMSSSQTFATNSTLDDTGHIPSTLPSSDYFILKIKILHYNIFHDFSDLNYQKAYGPDGVPPVVLKNCTSKLAPCLVKIFRVCLYFYLSFLLEEPILQSTAQKLSFPAFLKPLSLFLTRR